MNAQTKAFIARHRTDRAVEFKVASRGSGLDLMKAEKVPKSCVLEGTLVAKTWAQGRSKMIWAYLLTDSEKLYTFHTYKWAASTSKVDSKSIADIALGSVISAVFAKTSKGRIFCKSVDVLDD